LATTEPWCMALGEEWRIWGCMTYGYGSISIDTFLMGWTSIYQLFWGSLGTRVLTHPHIWKFKDHFLGFNLF
jgi:hypothetical protein